MNDRRFVRLDLLKPGDILLVRSRGKFSAAIARASRGRFSHAMVAVHRQAWFESNDRGVGYVVKRVTKLERLGSLEDRELGDISEFEEFEALRHPVLEARYRNRFDEGHSGMILDEAFTIQIILQCICSKFIGYQYPPLSRLVLASPLLCSFPRVMRLALGLFGRIDDWWNNASEIVAPGPFCSELVVRIYRELECRLGEELTLVENFKGARWISPNDLARPGLSKLHPVPGVVVREDTSLPDEAETYVDRQVEDNMVAVFGLPIDRRNLAVTRHASRDIKMIAKRK
jgi:hypothetical protein